MGSEMCIRDRFTGARTFVVLDLSFVAGIFRTLFFTAVVTCCICCVSVFPNFCTCSLLAVAIVVWVVCRCSGQSVSYSFAQSSTDWFCSLSCPPVASLIFLAVCGAALLVLICIFFIKS